MSTIRYGNKKDVRHVDIDLYSNPQPHCSKDFLSSSRNPEPSRRRNLRIKSQGELYDNYNEDEVYPSTSNRLKGRRHRKLKMDEPLLKKPKKVSRKAIMYKDMLNFSRPVRNLMHKVNILCLIAYGNRINDIINDDLLRARLLSLVPSALIPDGHVDKDYFLDLMEWFRARFLVCNIKLEDVLDYKNFENVFHTSTVICLRDYIMIFVSLLRALGLVARYVISFQPYPVRVGDFEAESSCEEDNSDISFSDVVLKKGRGLVRSKKGKDKFNNRSFERWKHIFSLTEGDIEVFIIKKYHTVLASAIDRKRVKLDHWVEVLYKGVSQMAPVNIFHHTVNNIGSVCDHLTTPVKYCLSWSRSGEVEDVTDIYASESYVRTSRRFRFTDPEWISNTFDMFDKSVTVTNGCDDVISLIAVHGFVT